MLLPSPPLPTLHLFPVQLPPAALLERSALPSPAIRLTGYTLVNRLIPSTAAIFVPLQNEFWSFLRFFFFALPPPPTPLIPPPSPRRSYDLQDTHDKLMHSFHTRQIASPSKKSFVVSAPIMTTAPPPPTPPLRPPRPRPKKRRVPCTGYTTYRIFMMS